MQRKDRGNISPFPIDRNHENTLRNLQYRNTLKIEADTKFLFLKRHRATIWIQEWNGRNGMEEWKEWTGIKNEMEWNGMEWENGTC